MDGNKNKKNENREVIDATKAKLAHYLHYAGKKASELSGFDKAKKQLMAIYEDSQKRKKRKHLKK